MEAEKERFRLEIRESDFDLDGLSGARHPKSVWRHWSIIRVGDVEQETGGWRGIDILGPLRGPMGNPKRKPDFTFYLYDYLMITGTFDLQKWIDEHPEAAAFVKPRRIPVEQGQRCKPWTAADASRSVRRAAGWLRRLPGAVSGKNGHGRTLFVAVILIRGFLLPREDAWKFLKEWSSSCDPPWSDGELQYKLDEAEEIPCREADGWMLRQRNTTLDHFFTSE